MPAESTYCGPCGADHVRHVAVAEAAVLALWGTAGLTQWQTELRTRRLAAGRTTRPGRNATTERTTS